MPFLYLGYIPHHPTVFLNLGYKPVSSKDGWVYNLPGLSHEFKISTSRMDSSADTARLLKSWGMGRGLKAKAPVPAPRVGDWPGAPGVLGPELGWTQHDSTQKRGEDFARPKKGEDLIFRKIQVIRRSGHEVFRKRARNYRYPPNWMVIWLTFVC